MKHILLKTGESVIVDDEWYPILSQFKWHLTCKGYAERSVRPGYGIMMHRVVNMTPRELQTDHINGNKLDNRAENLRACTNSENSRARSRKVGASGYRGVSKKPRGRFEASIGADGKSYSIGCFGTAEEAARAYDKEAIRLHGGFATLNFPQDAPTFLDQ